MNIVCVVKSLDLIGNNLSKKIELLLGESVKRKLSVRTMRIETDTARIHFVSCDQNTNQFCGMLIDVVIIEDPDTTKAWYDFLRIKTYTNNGIILRVEQGIPITLN